MADTPSLSDSSQVDMTTTIGVVISVIVGVSIAVVLLFLLRRRIVADTAALEMAIERQGNVHRRFRRHSAMTDTNLPAYEEKQPPTYEEAYGSHGGILHTVMIPEEQRTPSPTRSITLLSSTSSLLRRSVSSLLPSGDRFGYLRRQLYGIPLGFL
ncbi:hypothetical protein SeMB42_g04308 [Synchytrium endobioticum]|nr:hypothetical protein SeMB42_g04308 [Synchytrium endobioticum]